MGVWAMMSLAPRTTRKEHLVRTAVMVVIVVLAVMVVMMMVVMVVSTRSCATGVTLPLVIAVLGVRWGRLAFAALIFFFCRERARNLVRVYTRGERLL